MNVTIRVTDDLAACHALRRAVFIAEQGIAEADEWDDLDGACIHLLACDANRPVGTARVFRRDEIAYIGRVCVLATHRGTGLGAHLIRAALEQVRAMPGVTTARLGAQIHAIGFYERLGFVAFGPQYDDAGIPHRDIDHHL
ncbi:GNAT family N-acetyltransferase [Oceaniglobus indicus]|uniref:GNAT family N-acetyltransferase n=1 Tax=Oceaniglobus indicus TaxID=2047749 RepID=UPI000C188AD0|nr:GNAT family N-acetyltransferase [Oceaniglobus indicus]